MVLGAVKNWNEAFELILKGVAVVTAVFIPLLRYQYKKLKKLIEDTYQVNSKLLHEELEIHRDILATLTPPVTNLLPDVPAALIKEKWDRLHSFIREHHK